MLLWAGVSKTVLLCRIQSVWVCHPLPPCDFLHSLSSSSSSKKQFITGSIRVHNSSKCKFKYLSWFDSHIVVLDASDHETQGLQHLLVAAGVRHDILL
jgi:hypothetical protein